MALHIDYFLSLSSPWAHLGAARLEAMVAAHGATVRVYPVDLGAVFAASGGLPLLKRSVQRRAYREVELRRWREHLGIPINIPARHAPMAEAFPAACVIAARETIDDASAMRLAHRIMGALWEDEVDPADESTLAVLLEDAGIDPEAHFPVARDPQWEAQRAADTASALGRGVFGAPSYVIGGEVFWGQDRLDFVQRRLARR